MRPSPHPRRMAAMVPAYSPDLPPDLASALAAVTAVLRDPAVPLDAALRRVCELSAAATGVERVGVWLLTEAGRTLRCLTVFERSRGQHSHGTTLRTTDFPRYFAALAGSPSLPAADARQDARTSELTEAYLDPLGVVAMLDTPVVCGAEVLGVVCHEHSGGPREWSAAELRYADALAGRLAGRLAVAAAAPAGRPGLDHLAAGVAHDFKNLLTVILGYADIVARRATLAEPDRDALRRIAEAAERGSVLADDLMLIASDRPRRPRVISPARAIEAALPVLRSLVGLRHDLRFDGGPPDGRVFLDPSGFDRVVANLVLNARDASPDGGPITVRVADDGGPLDGHPDQPYKRIEVADRGTGIDPSVRDRLFEPFVSTKPSNKGTGLGLAIVKQIVDRAGGTIRVESAPGEGTTMHVYLPRVSADPPANS